jgi:SlyX protein
MNDRDSDPARIQQRFLTLETKVAYQEKLIADLNDVILDRGREFDALAVRVNEMEKLLREGPGETPGHEPPPHY